MGSHEGDARAKEIGRRITEARKETGGMKQRELADLLGVSERSVIAYEKGEVIPYRFMQQLESALGRPAAWFLHGDDAVVPVDEKLVEILSELRKLRAEVRKALE